MLQSLVVNTEEKMPCRRTG